MSRRDAIDSLFLKKPDPSQAAGGKNADRVRTGAISAMGASLHEMAETAKQVNQLRQQLADGEAVVSIEPERIEASTVRDRIEIDIDPAFDALVASIAENGQQVPILVRPLADDPGRFQIAYGRRRLKAAQVLGRPVRAIVRDLSDSELIIAQGRENLDRKDLSFIERAFFARNLEDGGCDRATVIAALGADKGDVSRYIAVARQVPEHLVAKIGPAPKAGRARWLTLAVKLASDVAIAGALHVLDDLAAKGADSDARFEAVLKALDKPAPAVSAPVRSVWKTPPGKAGVRIDAREGKTVLMFDETSVPAFADFVTNRLDALYREFEAQMKDRQQG